jgi:hypothetical protein
MPEDHNREVAGCDVRICSCCKCRIINIAGDLSVGSCRIGEGLGSAANLKRLSKSGSKEEREENEEANFPTHVIVFSLKRVVAEKPLSLEKYKVLIQESNLL